VFLPTASANAGSLVKTSAEVDDFFVSSVLMKQSRMQTRGKLELLFWQENLVPSSAMSNRYFCTPNKMPREKYV
jgi:hypothetical protein